MLSPERLEQLHKLEQTLNYSFSHIELLNISLTHKSFANEINNLQWEDNERLEFLGDAVMDLVISDYFFKKFSLFDEGELTKIRAALVNENCLAGISRKIILGDFILLGKGEESTAGRDKSSILGNALEAVIAAVYLDGGLQKIYDIIVNLFKTEIDQIVSGPGFKDFKSEFQEYTQEKLSCIPAYRVSKEFGPPHNRYFEVDCLVKEKIIGSGKGKSKKEAEQLAAKDALNNILHL